MHNNFECIKISIVRNYLLSLFLREIIYCLLFTLKELNPIIKLDNALASLCSSPRLRKIIRLS